MLNLEVKTKLSQEEVMNRVKRAFGKEGLGLDLKEDTPSCLTFEGGGGYVNATVCEEEDGQTRIDFVTQEWDYHVKELVSKLS
jgi:hypothetical protein